MNKNELNWNLNWNEHFTENGILKNELSNLWIMIFGKYENFILYKKVPLYEKIHILSKYLYPSENLEHQMYRCIIAMKIAFEKTSNIYI